MWYLSDRTWLEPNIVLLNNALKQTGFSGVEMTATNWRKEIATRVSEYDWHKVHADIYPFLEKQEELKIITKENIIKLLNAGS
jgi:hypothetical protein